MSPRLLPLVLLLGACNKSQESNAVDLPPVADTPVKVEGLKMTTSTYARLGPGGVELSSNSKHNAIGLAYDVHKIAETVEYAAVDAQLACRVGEHTVRTPLAHDAGGGLHGAAVGAKLSNRTVFPPTPFDDAIPSVCEATLYYAVVPPLDVPARGQAVVDNSTRVALGSVCYADNTLAVGPCDGSTLPRVAAAAPLEVSRLDGRIGSVSGGGYGVEISVLITAGEGVPDRVQVGADAVCEVDGEREAAGLSLLMTERGLAPGESAVGSGATTARAKLSVEPAWCEVTISSSESGTKTKLADFCVRGQTAEPGTCG